mmetsp:Transcript_82002/g.237108  ORF Transcript_82002/g.237108 Transcript_82002/m.237108 type:complete len:225 (-) Transcript_82002:78-752(-)
MRDAAATAPRPAPQGNGSQRTHRANVRGSPRTGRISFRIGRSTVRPRPGGRAPLESQRPARVARGGRQPSPPRQAKVRIPRRRCRRLPSRSSAAIGRRGARAHPSQGRALQAQRRRPNGEVLQGPRGRQRRACNSTPPPGAGRSADPRRAPTAAEAACRLPRLRAHRGVPGPRRRHGVSGPGCAAGGAHSTRLRASRRPGSLGGNPCEPTSGSLCRTSPTFPRH